MPSPPLIPKAMNDGWLPWLTSQLDLKSVLSCLIIEHLRGVTLSVKITFSSLLFDVFGLPPVLYFFIFGEASVSFFFNLHGLHMFFFTASSARSPPVLA